MLSYVVILVIGLTVAFAQDPCDPSTPPPVISESNNVVIQSPGYANGSYPPNSNCSWLISSNLGQQSDIDFLRFDVEDCPNCECDYLDLYSGMDATAPLDERWCGVKNDWSVVSEGPMFLNFVSDSIGNNPGFEIHVNFDNIACIEEMHINEGSGSMISSGYPDNYPDNSQCQWYFYSADPNKTVALTISDFQLEPGCPLNITDYVTFSDIIDGIDKPILLGYWYGTMPVGGFTYTGYSSSSLLAFVSGPSNNFRGFSINYTFVPIA